METLDDERRYAAIAARDPRFDGEFFTCVRTTGIFCRPSCPARTPGRVSVTFVPSAAAAVAAGYRACKRCGPLAPPRGADADPGGDLAARALDLIAAGALDAELGTDAPAPHVADLAALLHVSERNLHRALLEHTGASAVAHARMARARRAHELLRGTDRPLGEIAAAAGFGSERQLHDTVRAIYGVAPSTLRPRSGRPLADTGTATAELRVDLAVRRPFDGAGLAAWFAARAVPGVEGVEGLRWSRAVRLPHGPAVLGVDLGVAEGPLPLTLRLADLRDYRAAVALVRRLLDLDADPRGIDAGLTAAVPALAGLVAARPGVRIPGTSSVAEALLWAVVGQQVTVVQTREQIIRATDLLAEPLPEPLSGGGSTRLPVDPARAADRAEEWFRGPAARRRTLAAALGTDVDAEAPLAELEAQLLAIPGVGPWTAQYALLRGRRAIDQAPPRDAALLNAARDLGIAEDHAALQRAVADASPWRSYAALHLWHHAATPTRKDTP